MYKQIPREHSLWVRIKSDFSVAQSNSSTHQSDVTSKLSGVCIEFISNVGVFPQKKKTVIYIYGHFRQRNEYE